MAKKMKTFRVVFHNNMGSRAVDAIATTVQGNWRNTVDNFDGNGNDLAFIDVPAGNAAYLVEMLTDDPNVVDFSER